MMLERRQIMQQKLMAQVVDDLAGPDVMTRSSRRQRYHVGRLLMPRRAAICLLERPATTIPSPRAVAETARRLTYLLSMYSRKLQ
jgi:hypothetical protein